jgi:hypothetical protein
MQCSAGRVDISVPTRDRLFAFSGGVCAKCRGPLFPEGSKRVTIADQAHIVGASDEGPRGKSHLDENSRSRYENLVLLCPNCHREVDGLPNDFPVSLLTRWKNEVENGVRNALSAKTIETRVELSEALQNRLDANHAAWKGYGPDAAAARDDVEGEGAAAWDRKVKNVILPNNLQMLQILDDNVHLTTSTERVHVEQFRQHVDDLAARHLDGVIESAGARFPHAFGELVKTLASQ